MTVFLCFSLVANLCKGSMICPWARTIVDGCVTTSKTPSVKTNDIQNGLQLVFGDGDTAYDGAAHILILKSNSTPVWSMFNESCAT